MVIVKLRRQLSVPTKLIFFFSKSAFLLGTRRFIFNFPIVKHAKTAEFMGTRCHTKILVGILRSYLSRAPHIAVSLGKTFTMKPILRPSSLTNVEAQQDKKHAKSAF